MKVRELYKKDGGKFPDPVLNATFAYTNPYNPSLAEVAKEINGKALADITDPKTNITIKAGQQLPGFAWLKDDGTTLSGNWLYCGSWTEAGAMMQRRGTDDPSGLGIYPNWGWSWPSNRRVLLSDTVGFIRNLPHTLVTAFRATLEEVQRAALILHVSDASSALSDRRSQLAIARTKDLRRARS